MFLSYIAFFILIVGIFLTAKLWLWIYKNAFGIQINKKIIFLSLFIGGITAASILLFPKMMEYFHIENFINGDYSWTSVGIFMIYLNLLILCINTIFKSFSIKGVINLFFFNIFFIISILFVKILHIDDLIINIVFYYLFVAYGEEFIKNQLALSVNKKIGQVDSDILLYHILVAIGFAFWENIVYLIGTISFEKFLVTLVGGLGIVVLRGILGFGAHTFYSSLIGMGNIISIIFIPIFITIAMLIHYVYDISLYFNVKIIIPIFIISIYMWLSYVFYKLDRMYIDE